MVTIERLGKETGLWDTVIRTDTEALTKRKLEYNAKNLGDFDAVVFYTGGTLEMDAGQQLAVSRDGLACRERPQWHTDHPANRSGADAIGESR